MKRVLMLAAVAASLAAPAGAGAATSAKLSVNYWNGTEFVGFIKSSKASCYKNRAVSLFQQQAGPDAKLGTNHSVVTKGPQGVWHIPASPANAVYYAKMPAKTGCTAERSKDFHYPEDQP